MEAVSTDFQPAVLGGSARLAEKRLENGQRQIRRKLRTLAAASQPLPNRWAAVGSRKPPDMGEPDWLARVASVGEDGRG